MVAAKLDAGHGTALTEYSTSDIFADGVGIGVSNARSVRNAITPRQLDLVVAAGELIEGVAQDREQRRQ